MKIVKGIRSIKKQRISSVVTIGVFDGVHKAHQLILKKLVNQAKKRNLQSIVITFDPHPLDILKPKDYPTTLTSLNLKVRLLKDLGVNKVIIIKFSKSFAALSADEFVKEYLIKRLKMKELIIGTSFSFGRNKEGNISLLKKLAKENKFKILEIDKIKDEHNRRISSTHIRGLIHNAELEKAANLLGRYPTFIGKVHKGKGRGDITGFHTANVKTEDKASIPKNGVYAGYVEVDKIIKKAVICIGSSPTFKDKTKQIEAHIIGFNKELYGKQISVAMAKRIREIKWFKSPKDLSKQIEKDIEKAKKVLN